MHTVRLLFAALLAASLMPNLANADGDKNVRRLLDDPVYMQQAIAAVRARHVVTLSCSDEDIAQDLKFNSLHSGFRSNNCLDPHTRLLKEGSDGQPKLLIGTIKLKDGGQTVAYIYIPGFFEGAAQRFLDNLERLLSEEGPHAGLIFDLVGNEGGLIKEMVGIYCLLAKPDSTMPVVAYKERVAEGTRVVTIKANTDTHPLCSPEMRGRYSHMPIVFTVNRGTASAAEMLIVALRGSGRVTLGEQTYGKPFVMDVESTSDPDVRLHITAGLAFDPHTFTKKSGSEPWLDGLEPDFPSRVGWTSLIEGKCPDGYAYQDFGPPCFVDGFSLEAARKITGLAEKKVTHAQ